MIYNCLEEPLKLYGLNHIKEGAMWRLPLEMLKKMPQYESLGRRCAGGRLRFKTNSGTIKIRYGLSTESVDRCMALPAAAGIDVYIGTGIDACFAGYAAPSDYGYKDEIVEGVFQNKKEMENITVNLPRNEHLSFMTIETESSASIYAPDEYRIKKPIVFYGSSITEGGCAPRPGAAYTSIISRWLDVDHFNYGFSGGAKGETEFAEFIALHEMSLFVYDYDHNSPSPEHLAVTHEPFLKLIRAAHPELPVIVMSRPDFDKNPEDSIKRRSVIYRTYMNFIENGDRNIYFIDGEKLFGPIGREECTIDGCHPTGLGFMRMAEAVYPVAARILK